MRTLILGLALNAIAAVPICRAEDTNYQFEITSDSELEEPTLSEPFSIAVKDRVWTTKGIEESFKRANVTGTFKADRARRLFRIEPGREDHCCTGMTTHRIVIETPHFVDDEFWPRTKDLLEMHRTRVARSDPGIPPAPDVVYVGTVGLQR
jgi:hypothetical protein